LKPYANAKIDFGMLKDSIAYLRILAFEGYTKNGSFEQDVAALQETLDEVFTSAERMKGLIIDVRVNTGGADPLALAIASAGQREVPRLLESDARQSQRASAFHSATVSLG
jgi:C-terminal processing protease CtpA/Prc